MTWIKKHGFTGDELKWIAMLSMLTDHMGYVLFPQLTWMRIVGRIAFPIYCFLLSEGFFHTSNRLKYLERLLGFAVLSEVPFDMAIRGRVFDMSYNNVMWTLAIALLVMIATEETRKRTGSMNMGLLFCMAGMYLAYLLHTDYDAMGVMLCYLFYLSAGTRNCGEKKRETSAWMLTIIMAALLFTLSGGLEIYAGFSLVFLLLYSGKKSRGNFRAGKYLFYAFYPLHLLILGLFQI